MVDKITEGLATSILQFGGGGGGQAACARANSSETALSAGERERVLILTFCHKDLSPMHLVRPQGPPPGQAGKGKQAACARAEQPARELCGRGRKGVEKSVSSQQKAFKFGGEIPIAKYWGGWMESDCSSARSDLSCQTPPPMEGGGAPPPASSGAAGSAASAGSAVDVVDTISASTAGMSLREEGEGHGGGFPGGGKRQATASVGVGAAVDDGGDVEEEDSRQV
jgi:hypothetical protein